MIPRKVAKRLLEEYLERVQDAEGSAEPLDGEGLARVRDELLDESDLVLRGAENIEQKARRYLTEGRLIVVSRNPQTGLVVAKCRGTDAMYSLGFDPRRNEWRCTCPGPRSRRCSHLVALRLVVTQA